MYMEEYGGYEEGYEDTAEEMSYDDTPLAHSAQSADGNKGNQEDGDNDDGKGQRQILGRFLFFVLHRQLFEVSGLTCSHSFRRGQAPRALYGKSAR